MDMGTMTSMPMGLSTNRPTQTSSSLMTATTDYTPGTIDSQGRYVPTAAERTAYQAARIPWAKQVLSWVWTFGALGPNLVLFAGLLFATGFTFINEYYYYPPFYGSAPLYLRSEWIAMATLPLIFVLGSKRNIISVLTGVSHEKLQVLHQGAAFNFTYMSIVHTVASCIRAIRERGLAGTMAVNGIYVSGFVALAPLLVLFTGALPPFRRGFYESFYWVHIIMAVFFLGAMFWHGYRELDSDAYMIATIVLFLSSVTWRLVMVILNNPTLHLAKAEIVDEDGTLKLTIPTMFIDWHAGQHVFIRFVGVRPFDSHPFSLATTPSPPSAKHDYNRGSIREMVCLLKPVGGFTMALSDKVKCGANSFKVLVDGPYGGVEDGELRKFDRVLICVAGTGVTWGLSVLQDLVWYGEAGQEVTFVWVFRKTTSIKWFERELDSIRLAYPYVDIRIHITGATTSDIDAAGVNLTPTEGSDVSSSANKESELINLSNFHTQSTRPDMPHLIEKEVAIAAGSLAVATCGPRGFLSDCANAVTRAQIGILSGKYHDLSEVYMKSESFGW
ncbi:uncharacterized protein I303_108709 [Kwoniella dejecticola CBS 10117]|uniref:ferric-chelate reductase (NADPH) n=1 Tax=Kwoniella dejecticola CBS 10117 TaxID=1296121 RepID=A0AAJ8KX60_9TREE